MDLLVIGNLDKSFFAGYNPDVLVHIEAKDLFAIHLPKFLRGKRNFGILFASRQYKAGRQHVHSSPIAGLKRLLHRGAVAFADGKLVGLKSGCGRRNTGEYLLKRLLSGRDLRSSARCSALCSVNTLGSYSPK